MPFILYVVASYKNTGSLSNLLSIDSVCSSIFQKLHTGPLKWTRELLRGLCRQATCQMRTSLICYEDGHIGVSNERGPRWPTVIVNTQGTGRWISCSHLIILCIFTNVGVSPHIHLFFFMSYFNSTVSSFAHFYFRLLFPCLHQEVYIQREFQVQSFS